MKYCDAVCVPSKDLFAWNHKGSIKVRVNHWYLLKSLLNIWHSLWSAHHCCHTLTVCVTYKTLRAEDIKHSSSEVSSICTHTNITYLLAVFADIRVDLIESAEHVELRRVESGLFCQISIHVLVANGWQPVDVSVVPGDATEGQHLELLTQNHSKGS